MKRALDNAIDSNGDGNFKSSLQRSGMSNLGVIELRALSPAINNQIDVTPVVELTAPDAVSQSSGTDDSSSSSMSGATIGIIVGAVAGGIAIIALVTTLLISHSRRSESKDKESIVSQWKLERELAEAEKMKLENENRPRVQGSMRWSSAKEPGFTTSSRDDLARKTEIRRAQTRNISERLASGYSITEPKPSKLDSMRNALGLGKSTSSEQASPLTQVATAHDEASVESKSKFGSFFKSKK